MANVNSEEGEAICNIPLSRRQVLDLVYWMHSKDGNFTTKSAYKVAKTLLKKEDWVELSSGCAVKRVWLPYGSYESPTR